MLTNPRWLAPILAMSACTSPAAELAADAASPDPGAAQLQAADGAAEAGPDAPVGQDAEVAASDPDSAANDAETLPTDSAGNLGDAGQSATDAKSDVPANSCGGTCGNGICDPGEAPGSCADCPMYTVLNCLEGPCAAQWSVCSP